MKPSLFGSASTIRPEENFEGERLGSCKRMVVDEDRIVDAVELDRLPKRRLDDAWMTNHYRRKPTNMVQTIERPHGRALLSSRSRSQPQAIHKCHERKIPKKPSSAKRQSWRILPLLLQIRGLVQSRGSAQKVVEGWPTVRKCKTGARPNPVVWTLPSKQADAP